MKGSCIYWTKGGADKYPFGQDRIDVSVSKKYRPILHVSYFLIGHICSLYKRKNPLCP